MADQPGYTRVPNALLELLPTLPDAECRILLAIARKTLGWQKACDVISISQLRTATGMSQQGVINGIESAIKRGILKREPSGHNNGYCYEIVDQVVNEIDDLDRQSTKETSQRSRRLVVSEVDDLSPQVVNEVDTQKKDLKERKERSARRAKRAVAPAEKTDHQKIMDAYAEVLGYPIRDGPKEGNAAKWLVNNHYTAEQVAACYTHLKARSFYAQQHVSLQTVASQIGAYLQGKNGHANGKHIRPDPGQHRERGKLTETDLDRGF